MGWERCTARATRNSTVMWPSKSSRNDPMVDISLYIASLLSKHADDGEGLRRSRGEQTFEITSTVDHTQNQDLTLAQLVED